MLKEESSQHESQDFLDEAVFWAEATWGKGNLATHSSESCQVAILFLFLLPVSLGEGGR